MMPERRIFQPAADDSFEATYPSYEFSELVRLSLALAHLWTGRRRPSHVTYFRRIEPSENPHFQPESMLGSRRGLPVMTPP